MHRRFRGLPVVAFEPQPELIEFLSDLKKTFHLERLVIAPVGLSSCSGTLRLHRESNHWGGATVDRSSYDFKDADRDVFDVPITTIDDYLSKHPELRPVRFIKCDVEYHEDEVIAGAERTLLEDRPELIVEWTIPDNDRRRYLFARLQKLNYSIFQFEFGRLTICNSAERDAPHSWKLSGNYLLLPRERATSAAA
jgi:FkbM family methyltransferase